MSHSKALKSLEIITNTLMKDGLTNERGEIKRFIQWFLLKKNKFVIYIGAGASKTVETSKNKIDYEYSSKNWRELLVAMYEALDDPEKKEDFLKSSSARVGKLTCLKNGKNDSRSIQELKISEWKKFSNNSEKEKKILNEVLDKLGPFRSAWSLRWFFDKDNFDRS